MLTFRFIIFILGYYYSSINCSSPWSHPLCHAPYQDCDNHLLASNLKHLVFYFTEILN